MGQKFESLKKLAVRGFNTPKFVGIHGMEQLEKFNEDWERISVRTDYKSLGKKPHMLPFFPNMPREDAIRIARNLMDVEDEMMIILQEAIDPHKSLIAGKFMVDGDTRVLEYFVGPGTIRQMEDDSVPRETIIFQNNHGMEGRFDPEKMSVQSLQYIDSLRRMMILSVDAFFNKFCIEWSIYPYSIGTRGKNLIYWQLEELR